MLNTLNYMIAGYLVIFFILGSYILHLVRKSRKLKQEKERLENKS